MNRLTGKAPETVIIDGVGYKINYGFRDCLKCVLALRDNDLTVHERIGVVMYNLYTETPQSVNEAVTQALWFLRCGRENDTGQPGDNICDFDIDADRIYGAILKKGIDLDKCGDMHWWTFMAHFAEIDESAFSRICYLRSRHRRGALTKDERRECEHIGWDVINMRDTSVGDEIMAFIRGEG